VSTWFQELFYSHGLEVVGRIRRVTMRDHPAVIPLGLERYTYESVFCRGSSFCLSLLLCGAGERLCLPMSFYGGFYWIYRGMHAHPFLITLLPSSVPVAPPSTMYQIRLEKSDSIHPVALDHSQPFRQHQQQRHRRRMDLLSIPAPFSRPKRAATTLEHRTCFSRLHLREGSSDTIPLSFHGFFVRVSRFWEC
jgi:hypothetical protein